jgi:dUTP pyrophosphatase
MTWEYSDWERENKKPERPTIKVYEQLSGQLQQSTPQASGMDIRSNSQHYLAAKESCIIDTGLFVQMPEDLTMFIFSRSGHGFKQDICLSNSVGVIDADYRGEIKVKLINHGDTPLEINIGDRIAQAVFVKHEVPKIVVVTSRSEFSETLRGSGGFGSTGS